MEEEMQTPVGNISVRRSALRLSCGILATDSDQSDPSSPCVLAVISIALSLINSSFTIYTRNLGYTKVMSIVEQMVHHISEENPEWTVAERSAWIDSLQVFGFSRAIQVFGLNQFKKSCAKISKGCNCVLANYISPHSTVSKSDIAFSLFASCIAHRASRANLFSQNNVK
ncbi:uncharacterized protein LOC112463652 [Temnothorax curvispinosus]|uniref:Uncharacterized protein LOC112463652 n=1 Tax=Temnothorax curvispinosus TaxID=300111 RepID=A0A6J1QVK9_9HYME|nr:uncharacterized protein LOC112463652 [Temnothorax curvispinosus]